MLELLERPFLRLDRRSRPSNDLVRGDRLVLYVKQQLERLIASLQAKTTKTIGESAWNLRRLVRETADLAMMGGEDPLAELVFASLSGVTDRTLRTEVIERSTKLRDALDEYVPVGTTTEIEQLRSKIALLEQQQLTGSPPKATSADLTDLKSVFVIMPFSPEFADVWKGGIERACTEGGLRAIRADMINRSTNITDDIVDSINNCHIAIVDVTGGNPNVMFELGYVFAAKKPHIIISQSAEYLPFDIRHIRTIVYQNSWSGIEQLRTRIMDFLKEHSRPHHSPKPATKSRGG